MIVSYPANANRKIVLVNSYLVYCGKKKTKNTTLLEGFLLKKKNDLDVSVKRLYKKVAKLPSARC